MYAQYITKRAILASRNEFVDKLNALMIDKFPEKQKHTSVLTQPKMIPTTTIKKSISTP